MGLRLFNTSELVQIDRTSVIAEELTSEAIRDANFESPAFHYDITTAAVEPSFEGLAVPANALAEVRRLVRFPYGNARRRDARFRVMLNDPQILTAADRHVGTLDAILLFVLTHELFHVIRFATFRREFEPSRRAQRREEKIVAGLTRAALSRRAIRKTYRGLSEVLESYGG